MAEKHCLQEYEDDKLYFKKNLLDTFQGNVFQI